MATRILVQKIDDVLTFHTEDGDVALPSDQSFVVTHVATPVQPHGKNEKLFIHVGERPAFCWPLELLTATYRRWTEVTPPEVFADMHECMQLMTRDLTQRWRMDRSKDIPWEKVAEIEAATQVLKAFATAIAALTGGPGIELSNAILIPPRMNVRVVTSEGSPLRVYLRGLRSRNVA